MSRKAVLISGASGGIGAATADRFLASGYEVLGVDLVEPPQERAGLRTIVTDVRTPDALGAAVDELTRGVELKHVVGLAGRALPEELGVLGQDLAAAVGHFSASIELNLTAHFALVHATLGKLRAAGGDRSITLCSSISALSGEGPPAYSAAKAGLQGLMNALAAPLGKEAIRVNVVAPGTTRTPLTESEAAPLRNRKRFKRAAARIPTGRVGEADDVAVAIEALAIRLTHVNAQVLRVDGGQLLPS